MSKKRITLGDARNLALQIQRDTDERLAIERAEEAKRLEDPRITELEAENARLRAALEIYAKPEHWRPAKTQHRRIWIYNCYENGFKIAQAALAPKTKEGQ